MTDRHEIDAATWHKLDELPDEGRVQTVVVDGRPLAVTRCAGRLGALDNHCPHQGGPLGEGTIENGLLRCPWHGWEFDIRTGKSWCDPARTRVKSFDVSVTKGGALAEGPYQAETFPVSIDEDYVVVEI